MRGRAGLDPLQQIAQPLRPRDRRCLSRGYKLVGVKIVGEFAENCRDLI